MQRTSEDTTNKMHFLMSGYLTHMHWVTAAPLWLNATEEMSSAQWGESEGSTGWLLFTTNIFNVWRDGPNCSCDLQTDCHPHCREMRPALQQNSILSRIALQLFLKPSQRNTSMYTFVETSSMHRYLVCFIWSFYSAAIEVYSVLLALSFCSTLSVSHTFFTEHLQVCVVASCMLQNSLTTPYQPSMTLGSKCIVSTAACSLSVCSYLRVKIMYNYVWELGACSHQGTFLFHL